MKVSNPRNAGGWGRGSPVTRSDLQLLRRAIRQGWEIPERSREAILESLWECLEHSKPRLAISAAKTLLLMDQHGLLNDNN